MSDTTSVPAPTWTPTGFIAPAESAILTGLQADWQGAFGGTLNFTTTTGGTTNPTPQGQLTTSETAIIGDANDQFLFYVNQVDPAYASGRMQDGIGRLYFITRNPAQPTVVQATCTGLTGVVIPVGATAQATDGNVYTCTEEGTIPAGGSIVLPFACTVTGPIACPATSLSDIYQIIPGWDTITNLSDGDLGNVVESRAAFELRRSQSVAVNAQGSLPSVLGAVLSVDDVLDAYVTENNTQTAITVAGVTILPNSLYACVLGGAAQAIGNALWTKKAVGCGYTGNTSVTVVDSSYSVPQPSYAVLFETPTLTPILFLVTIANGATVPSTALALIQASLMLAFAGGDGGPRARIGSTIFASRYYAAVASLGSWAQVVSIQLGYAATALITGSIASTVLTVSALASGTLAVGQQITGTGVLPGTFIGSLGTGIGGVGTYILNTAQTVASTALMAITLGNSVTMNINAAPTIAATNISLALV